MPFQPQYETHRYTDEVTSLFSQSLVECRLPGSEIGTILAVSARAVCTECICADGEVRYGGKLRLCIVYEDGNKKVCRAERGAEFYHKAEGALVTPACFAKTVFQIDNLSHRREGSGLYISAVIGATSRVFGGKQAEYLVGGDEVVVKKQPLTLYKTVCVSGETEGEDEFETDYVGDILLHDETPLVSSCKVNAGQIEIEGEINVSVCVLKSDDSVCTYERLVPFSIQIPSEEAFGKVNACAHITVKEAMLTAGTDEEKGKSKIVFSYCLAADCHLTSCDELLVAVDAFSPVCETPLNYANAGGRYLTKQIKCVERVGGTAVLSPLPDNEYILQAAVLPKSVVSLKKTNTGFEAEGVLTAEILLKNAEGAYKSSTLSLPFVFPVLAEGKYAEADCMACGLNVRRSANGETQAEATLKLSVRCYDESDEKFVCAVEEGEPIQRSTAAVTLFIPRVGDDLWTVAKRRHIAPDELEKSNPELVFPIREGERIFVYRQIK